MNKYYAYVRMACILKQTSEHRRIQYVGERYLYVDNMKLYVYDAILNEKSILLENEVGPTITGIVAMVSGISFIAFERAIPLFEFPAYKKRFDLSPVSVFGYDCFVDIVTGEHIALIESGVNDDGSVGVKYLACYDDVLDTDVVLPINIKPEFAIYSSAAEANLGELHLQKDED